MSDTPKTPDRRYEERRYVESTRVVNEVIRDSWLSDEQALRLNCVNMACGVVEKPFLGKAEGDPGVETAVLRIAEAFRVYIEDGVV